MTIPWTPRLLRFVDRPAFLAALTAAGWASPDAVPAEEASLVELGTLRGPATVTGPPDAPVEAPGAALPGWHVRALFAGTPPAALASAEVAEVAGAPVVPSAEAIPDTAGLVVLEVLPVPLRTALAERPSPVPGFPDAQAAINAMVAGMGRPQQIAWEYLVIAKRADLLAMAGPVGLPEEWVDAVLVAAAAKPDSGAVWGARP